MAARARHSGMFLAGIRLRHSGMSLAGIQGIRQSVPANRLPGLLNNTYLETF
jgi:hypothetical protein